MSSGSSYLPPKIPRFIHQLPWPPSIYKNKYISSPPLIPFLLAHSSPKKARRTEHTSAVPSMTVRSQIKLQELAQEQRSRPSNLIFLMKTRVFLGGSGLFQTCLFSGVLE